MSIVERTRDQMMTEPSAEQLFALDADALRTRLLEERAEHVVTLDENRAAQPDDRSDVPDGPGETESLSSAEHLEVSGRLAALARVSITEIDAALARLDDGTYGECVACGNAIPPERLDALPAATHCVQCQASREYGSR